MKEDAMITETSPPPVFGHDGTPCAACGSPLAGDQRYCLHCGARRPEARLEFLDVLDADVRARGAVPLAAAAAPPAPPQGLTARLQANAGVLALSALLLLMLIAGLLVGHWATDARRPAPAAATPAPQVIRVEGAAGAGAPTTTSGDGGGAGDGGGSGATGKAKTKAKGASDSDASDKASAPKDAVSVKDLSSKKAVEDAVKKGKPISTGTGKLPPKDDKPAAGGSDFEEIG
jgi:hypothetical protein